MRLPIIQSSKIRALKSASASQWMELVLTNLNEGVCIIDEQMRILFANHAFAEMVNATRVELEGTKLWKVLPEVLERWAHNAKNPPKKLSAEMLSKLIGEYTLKNNDHMRIINLDVSRVPTIEQIMLVTHDITETKLYEIALQKRDDQLNEAQTIAHIGSWEWDVVNDALTWSDEMCRIYGKEPGFRGSYEDYAHQTHPLDRTLTAEIIKQALEQKTPFEFFHRIIRPDRTVRILHAKGQVIVDEKGRVVRMVGTGQDMTELKRAEQKLKRYTKEVLKSRKKVRQEKARLEAILGSIGKGLVATNVYGEIVLVNKAAEDMFQLKAVDMIGKICVDIISCEDLHGQPVEYEYLPLIRALTKREKVYDSNIYYRNHDGTRIPVAVTATPIIVRDHLAGAIMILRDMTADKNMYQSQNEFVSVASHELRTPLSAINWYTEMLLAGDAGELNSDQQTFLQEIYEGNQRMVALVNDLLNVSRVELGTFFVNPIPIQFTEMAHVVITDLRSQIMAKQLQINEHYDTVAPIPADAKLLRIIFQNLISNAIKYTPNEGSITIALRTKDANIEFSVTDTGVGIPKYQFPHIFTKMFRADNARSSEIDGTGLGLYIVKSIIEQSGGKIWFDSEENKGTTFYLQYPRTGMRKKDGNKPLT